MKNEEIYKKVALVLFSLSLLASPLFGFILLYGLNDPLYLVTGIAYFSLVITLFVSKTKPRFLFVAAVLFVAVLVCLYIDKNKADLANEDLCVKLRQNPTCVEDACGFQCSDHPLGSGFGMTVGGQICADKDLSLCQY